MPIITTAYEVDDTVYHVDANEGVRKGTVKYTDIRVIPALTTISYAIQFTNATEGSVVAEESTVFNDVDLALAAYKVMVE